MGCVYVDENCAVVDTMRECQHCRVRAASPLTTVLSQLILGL